MDIRRNRALPRTQLLLLMILACAGLAAAQTQSTCLECHSALSGRFQVTAEKFAQDIHSQKGLTCASCHGGDPTKADLEAMSKKAGFSGKVERSQIPALCGRCHSDGAFMRQYNPSLRTDQLSQYKTSVHGKLLAKGETKVAVCTDCHGVHDLLPASDTRSKVHPLNVAQTCARCHADTAYLKGYAIPMDQFAQYNTSVHHEAMVVRGDLSAPTCTTCHGNHGAAPREWIRFKTSARNVTSSRTRCTKKVRTKWRFNPLVFLDAWFVTAITGSRTLRTRSLPLVLRPSACSATPREMRATRPVRKCSVA